MTNRSKQIAMIGSIIVGVCALLTVAWAQQKSEKKHPGQAELANKQAQLKDETKRLLSAIEPIAAPLKTLSPEQQASVVALVHLTQAFSLATSPRTSAGQKDMVQFEQELGRVSPGLAAAGGFNPMRACMTESIACASALGKCEKKKQKEADCPDSWSPCAQEVGCVMRAIDSEMRKMNDLFGRLHPPKPGPWPPVQ